MFPWQKCQWNWQPLRPSLTIRWSCFNCHRNAKQYTSRYCRCETYANGGRLSACRNMTLAMSARAPQTLVEIFATMLKLRSTNTYVMVFYRESKLVSRSNHFCTINMRRELDFIVEVWTSHDACHVGMRTPNFSRDYRYNAEVAFNKYICHGILQGKQTRVTFESLLYDKHETRTWFYRRSVDFTWRLPCRHAYTRKKPPKLRKG